MAGIEPATDGLRNRCSTAELHWHPEEPPLRRRCNANCGKVPQQETELFPLRQDEGLGKSERRSPRSEIKPIIDREYTPGLCDANSNHSDFGLRISFEHRISDFGFL